MQSSDATRRETANAHPLTVLHRHAPPPGLAFREPDDRLRRGIQYPAASQLKLKRLWNTGSSGQTGRCQRRGCLKIESES